VVGVLFVFSSLVAVADFSAVNTTTTSVDISNSPSPQPKESISWGHNVTASGRLLGNQRFSIGPQVLAYGAQPNLTLATSPWLAADYGMYSLFARLGVLKTAERQQLVQLAYFKTGLGEGGEQQLRHYYQMESYWVTWVNRQRMNDHYDFTSNFGVKYYSDLSRPFSLRRPDLHNNPWQLQLSTLHEMEMARPFYLAAEIGTLYALQAQPYLHTGVTLQARTKSVLVQLGYSMTSTLLALTSPRERRDCQQSILQSGGTFHQHYTDDCYKYDYAIHPEFAAEYQF
jgi:hypothetical protein